MGRTQWKPSKEERQKVIELAKSARSLTALGKLVWPEMSSERQRYRAGMVLGQYALERIQNDALSDIQSDATQTVFLVFVSHCDRGPSVVRIGEAMQCRDN